MNKIGKSSPISSKVNDQSSTVLSPSDSGSVKHGKAENQLGKTEEDSGIKSNTDTKQSELVSSTGSVGDNEFNTGSVKLNGAAAENAKKSTPVMFKTVLTNPGHEYWRMKNPVADKVFITDVQVDLNTITIRECPTEKGFFKEHIEEEKDASNPS